MISFGREVCSQYPEGSRREWLLANGRGGYAFGTITGANTRRYHGLLVSASKPPVQRHVLVNRLDETLKVRGHSYSLASQAYPDSVQPGHLFLESFTQDPFPTFVYAVEDVRLEKTIFLRHGEDTVVVLYRLISGPEVTLELRPLVSFRNHHHLLHESELFQDSVERIPKGFRIFVPERGELLMQASTGRCEAKPSWYKNLQYDVERERGLDHEEDLFCPGVFELTLKEEDTAHWVASRGELPQGVGRSWFLEEQAKQDARLSKRNWRTPLGRTLNAAADQFVVSREKSASVIAGYPWFEDWGRDSMIALPGLFLATGREAEAKELLISYSQHIQDGILLNRFPENGSPPEYNNVDASLWFIWAVQKYHSATEDNTTLAKLFPVMKEVIQYYRRGTRHGIRMDSDGLILAGEPAYALTWMDAKVGDRVVTPRIGKPVEIQALWYNALKFLEHSGHELNDKLASTYGELATLAKVSFNKSFWNPHTDYLYDTIGFNDRDASIRPNALTAVSLPEPILDESRHLTVVNTAWRELYTSFGLRTLAKSDKRYQPVCDGGLVERDMAYHQGTVWAYLLGSFITAYLRAYGRSAKTLAQARVFLTPIEAHLSQGAVGSVSEIFDGDPPHTPRGCPAQAWSVAEILRVINEQRLDDGP